MSTNSGENLVSFDGAPTLEISMEPSEEVVEHSSDTPADAEPNVSSEPSHEDTVLSEKESEAIHLAILDTITDKFDDLSHGRITRDELKAWLDQNPVYHEKANKSKRLKEAYRDFMASYKEPTTQQKARQEEPVTASRSLEQLVQIELNKALAKKEAESAQQHFASQIDSFASERGLKGDDYTLFKKTASALKQAGIDQTRILDMAYNATVPQKQSGLRLPGGSVVNTQSADKSPDLSEGVTFFTIPLGK